MDAFDNLLGVSDAQATGWGDERVRPRFGGGYDAADRHDQGLHLWHSPLLSADADIIPDKPMLDSRSRDMMRNDAFVQGGANIHKDNIVGAHYLLNSRPATRTLLGAQDDVWEAEFQEEVEELWELTADSPDNWLDAQRTNNFTSMVRLAVGIHVQAGEVLATAEWIRGSGPCNTAIQMVDLDRLSDPMYVDPADRTNIRGGIRFDTYGAPQSYFIRTQHPHDLYNWGAVDLPLWKEVPIRKPWGRMQVIHLHEQTRPDQSRGVAEISAALGEMKYAKKFRTVQLQRAVMQSLFAAAITSELPRDQVMQAMGGGSMNPAAAVQEYATSYLHQINEYVGAAKGIKLDGARIPVFYPGTDLKILTPSDGVGVGGEFEQSLLRYIAASLGVSYEQLSRDYTNTNYSSARAAMSETWKFMQARKKLIADRFASLIFRLWLEEAINDNMITSFPKRKAGMLYTNNVLNLKFDAISRCEWVGASRGQIDELKETEAAVLRMEQGISTAEDELARLGKDWRKVYRQLKREQTMRETLGIVFPQANSATGAALRAPTDEPPQRKAA